MEASRFRRDRTRAASDGLTAGQVIGIFSALLLAVAAIAVAAAVVKPNRSRAFDLVRGTIFLSDARAPVAVDLASGKPTVRLVNARTQVDAASESGVEVLPLTGATLLLNRTSGAFNMVDSTGFVIKTSPGGVALPAVTGETVATAIGADDRAFVVRASAADTSVYLVAKTTVEAAVNVKTGVKPRAYRTLTGATTLGAGSIASADGALWLLRGTGAARTVTRLSVPAGSQTGAQLDSADYGSVSGIAALGTTSAPTTAGGSSRSAGSTVVGVATAGQIRTFDGAGRSRTINLSGLSQVDQIEPVAASTAGLAFLFHDASGWKVVTVDVDGHAHVNAVRAIAPTAGLARPVETGGRLYTVETGGDGLIWAITPGGSATHPAGATHYPTTASADGTSAEVRDFGDAAVVSRDGRVIFNSPDHLLALTVFTDGSHEPVTVDKSAAVDLNSAGGASALTKSRTDLKTKPPTEQPPTTQKPVTPPEQPINEKATCATTTQTPHVPTVTQATPAARSVLLAWNYPILDNQDCVPSTYVVQVKLLASAGAAPPAPGQVTIQGQQGVNLTGLYPNTRYEITVTAYINGKGTPSAPIQITTGREGPKAPTGVNTRVDGGGVWTISWAGCSDIQSGCVPAATWTVLPTFCDGLGLAAAPAPITISGDSTLTQFSTTFGGAGALLGRGLSFSVQGVSEQGDAGTSASDGTCTRSWAPPSPSIKLTGSVPKQVGLGQKATATFTLNLGGNPTVAAGGVGASFTYQLLQGGNVIATKGPTTDTTVTFDGISAGKVYSGRATVIPPGHPEAALTVTADELSTSSPWPAISVASAAVSKDSLLEGTLTVHVGGIASADAQGEQFDLYNSSFTCGSTSQALSLGSFDPASQNVVVPHIDLRYYNGNCSVRIQLVETAATRTAPPVFGGNPSAPAQGSVQMPGVVAPTFPAGVFKAAWNAAPSNSRSVVTVTATNQPEFVLVRSWSYQLDDGPDNDCGTAGGAPPQPVIADQDCVDKRGDAAHAGTWTVTISYQFYGSDTVFRATATVTGQPPTYHEPTPTPSTTPPTTTPITPAPTPDPTATKTK